MGRKLFLLLASLCLLVAGSISACASRGSLPAKSAALPKELTKEEKAREFVAHMSDAQKIGQFMMIGIGGTSLDQDARNMITTFPVGNVIYFDRNLTNPEQVKALSQSLSKTIKDETGLTPFIAIDQEGGMVMRMTDYLPSMPSAEALGQGTPETARDWAVKTAKELKNLGINTNFAPVVDLNGAYHRSYGKTPNQVIPFAKAVIQGYEMQGIKTSLKHFPGIGKVKTDPHVDGDVVSISREQLDKEDGRPFLELIRQTNPENTFVMVSNVTFPLLDANEPACLSKVIMTDILRKEYGFKGLILTDDMEMGAMAKHYAFNEMGVRAIKAGADIILVCHDYGHEQEVFNGLLNAYRDGRLDKKLIDEKVKRIVLIKMGMMEK